jgi:hypothetical protein
VDTLTKIWARGIGLELHSTSDWRQPASGQAFLQSAQSPTAVAAGYCASGGTMSVAQRNPMLAVVSARWLRSRAATR